MPPEAAAKFVHLLARVPNLWEPIPPAIASASTLTLRLVTGPYITEFSAPQTGETVDKILGRHLGFPVQWSDFVTTHCCRYVHPDTRLDDFQWASGVTLLRQHLAEVASLNSDPQWAVRTYGPWDGPLATLETGGP